ncbi:lamin tail domain-containing protein [Candidatus Kaiserbacteria bacterium]|nr:lamin tail domain-containing protein [Candidatus Kaiserbacteria bacterium]
MRNHARSFSRRAFAAVSVSALVVLPVFAAAQTRSSQTGESLGRTIFERVIQQLCEAQQRFGNRVRLVDPARCVVTPPPPTTATLTIIKTVINDNGGAATSSAFTLHLHQAPSMVDVAGSPQPGSATGTTYTNLAAGSYHVAETGGPSGYTLSYSGACDADGNVSLAAGDNKTCTVTNNDVAPSLTLNKIVVNDNGGTQPESAWTLDAAGPTPIFGPGGTTSADVVSGPSFQAGTYILSEVGPTGYSAIAWVCTGGGQQNGAEITILPGENVTCTITNDDNPPPPPTFTVTVHKYVEGAHATAASAESTSFPIESMWMAPLGATTTATSSLTTGNAYMTVSSAVATGTSYTTKELTDGSAVGASCAEGKPFALQGYTVGNTEVEAAGMVPDTDAPFLANITSDMHVIIWNMDCTPMLRVTKIVINDDSGTATTSDFALFIDGETTTSGVFADVTVGTHVVSEASTSTYTATFGGACDSSGNVTLAAGDRVECIITNDDNPAEPTMGTITITKVVVNDNGGTATSSDFVIHLHTGDPMVDVAGSPQAGSATGTAYTSLAPGSYHVAENATSTYSTTFSGDCDDEGDISLAAGESKTCTVTNDDIAAEQAGIILISEIAWMGSMVGGEGDDDAEWMELMNAGIEDIDLTGWTLNAVDGTPSISIGEVACANTIIPANGFLLLARASTTIMGVTADCTYTGALNNGGEDLELRDAEDLLVDNVPADTSGGWVAGNNDTKYTMTRTSSETWATLLPSPGS